MNNYLPESNIFSYNSQFRLYTTVSITFQLFPALLSILGISPTSSVIMFLLLDITSSITKAFLQSSTMSSWSANTNVFCLDLEVPQDRLVIFDHPLRSFLSWPSVPKLGTDVSARYANQFVIAFHVCQACSPITPHLPVHVLDFLRGIFWQSAQQCVVDQDLQRCHGYCLCAVLVGFIFFCWWYMFCLSTKAPALAFCSCWLSGAIDICSLST